MKINSRAFSLPGAIFLLLVIAVVAVYLVKLANSYQAITNLSVLGSQARFASQSGIEWSKKRAQTLQTSCFNNTTLSFTAGSLKGFNVLVTCSLVSAPHGVETFNIFDITTTASYGNLNDRDYANATDYVQILVRS